MSARTSSPFVDQEAEAPGPRGHFLLGSLADFKRDILGTVTQAQRDYGDILRFRLGPKTVYVLCHPDTAERVFIQDTGAFVKLLEGNASGLSLVLGNGLLTNYGESWRRQRRMIQPVFHHKRITAMADKMTAAGERMLARWETRYEPGQCVDIAEEMMRVTLDIVCRTMFDADLMEQADKIRKSLATALRYSFDSVRSPINLPLSWPTPRNREFKHALQTLDEVLYRLIEQRQGSVGSHGDLLDMLLQAHDDDTGEGMNMRQLRDEVATIFAAGHETTSNALAWTWYVLSQHPEIQQRLQAELSTVLGGRTPTLSDLSTLSYTRRVFEESLRLYPPAPLIPRLLTKDIELNGYRLAAGSKVFVSVYHIHRNPRVWPKPLTFDPERFTEQNIKGRHRCAWMPFGMGPRICIGNHFAIMEGQLLLAQIAQRYELRLVPDQPIEQEVAVTMRPRYGMKMTLHPRG